jgi:phosphatidylglycerophosphate synthase
MHALTFLCFVPAGYNPGRMEVATSVWYLPKAFGLFLAIGVIVGTRWRAHHPFPTFGIANQITLVRAFLVALTAGLIGEEVRPDIASAAIALGAIATALDGVDGRVARRTHTESAFGARFDMEIDALFVLVLATLVWRHGKAGSWVLLSGLLRYVFVIAGWLWPWMQRALFASLRRKAICFVQIVGLLAALMPVVTQPASSVVAAVSLAVLTYSFLADTVWLWQRR